MPIYRNLERKSSISASSLDIRLGKINFKRVRHPRNRFKKRGRVQRDSSQWVLVSQDGDKMSFEANSRLTKDFQKMHTIGQGGFGTVVKVKHNIDKCFYAIKCILFNLMDPQSKKIMKEAKLLSPLNHDNIVRYFNTWIDDCTVDEAKIDYEDTDGFSDTSSPNNSNGSSALVSQDGSNVPADSPLRSGPKQVLCIQMEFCKTTLADAINVSNLYKKHSRAWRIFWEIVRGLAYLNKKGVIHRDLKPQNIFLDTEDRVKIGDFGLATKIFRGSSTIFERDMNSLSAEVGTSLYRAPELDLVPEGSKAKYGQEIDIYSLGIILFEMFHPPFTTGSERCHVLTDLRKKEIIIPDEFMGDEKNAELIDLIRLLLNHNASVRPTCGDLLCKQKSKQLTNNKKTFQKQIRKKENINSIQIAYPEFYERFDSANYDAKNFNTAKFRNNTRKNNSTRYILENQYAFSLGYFSNVFVKVPQERIPELASTAGPIEGATPEEVKNALAATTWLLSRSSWLISKTVIQMAIVFNNFISNGKFLDLWTEIDKTSINVANPKTYRAVSVFQQSWENLIAKRLTRLVTPNPCRFTTDGAINCMKVLMEKYRSVKKEVYLTFIRLEKEQVPPELLWTALRAHHVPEQYIDLIKNLCYNVATGMRRPAVSNKKICLRSRCTQGSHLSPLLFHTAVNYVIEGLPHAETWTLLHGNIIVLASESVVELRNELHSWCSRLESRGLNVVRKKIEYLSCNFSDVNNKPPTKTDVDAVVKMLLK